MIAELKHRYGPYCSGLKINPEGLDRYRVVSKLRFCEAVNLSFTTPLMIDGDNLSCEGSRRSMGLAASDERLIGHILKECGASAQTVRKALINIPVLEVDKVTIFLGITEEMENEVSPDLFILQINPKQTMELIKQYIVKTDCFPLISTSPFLSICGSIFVRTFQQNELCISFGCPESRKYGGVDDCHLIVGIPFNKCSELLSM